MKRYVKELNQISYIVPEPAVTEFKKYLDNRSGFDYVEYDIQINSDGEYQFDCNIPFNVEFGIGNLIHELGYKSIHVFGDDDVRKLV